MDLTPRRWWLWLALIIVLSAARVAMTHRVFSQTSDEPWHLLAGYDILTKGDYLTDPEHPPLARFLFAIPFLNSPDPQGPDVQTRGNALLLRNERYTQNLARARMGNLVILAIAIVVVALWARHVVSPAAGLIAAILFASLPPILAHSGVATTDMAVTAMLPFALYSLILLLERPTYRRAIVFGVALAAGLLAKYSFVIYFPACALVLFISQQRFPLKKLLISVAIAFVLAWGVYGFRFSTMKDADPKAEEIATTVFGSPWIASAFPVPAPVYATGALAVKRHDKGGHLTFLLGKVSRKGWWYYFPIALALKTPVPFLILAFAAARARFELLALAATILGVAMTSHINIGVRHIMPLYAPLAIAAAWAVMRIPRWASAVLVGWLVVGSMFAHPDYLPWFNFMAGRHPERILNDSNLDWGQDVLRLVRTCRSLKIDHLTVSLFTTADLDKIGLPPHEVLQAFKEAHGWLAISEMNVAHGRGYSPELKKWLDGLIEGRPYRMIGKSIRLYDLERRESSRRAPPGLAALH